MQEVYDALKGMMLHSSQDHFRLDGGRVGGDAAATATPLASLQVKRRPMCDMTTYDKMCCLNRIMIFNRKIDTLHVTYQT